jgi:hypothetical protein
MRLVARLGALAALSALAADAQGQGAPRPEDARGLEDPPAASPEDAALFVPRAVLRVPTIVLGTIALPIRGGLGFVERHRIVEHVVDVLYNDERTAAIVPILSASSSFGVQVGARAFHDDLGGHGELGAIEGGFGADGERSAAISFEAPRVGTSPLWVETSTSFEEHPSRRFYGIGDDAEATRGATGLDPRVSGAESFYAHRRFRQISAAGVAWGPKDFELRAGGRGRLKRHDFDRARGIAEDDRQLASVFDPDRVPGFSDGATVAETEALFLLDARDRRGATNRGLYAEAFAGVAWTPRSAPWAHVGAEISGYADLWRPDRVLTLRLAFESVDGGEGEIPFVELPSLGGAHRLRGYPLHRFRDETAAVATLEYRYPIHELLAGALYLDVGEVAPDAVGLFRGARLHVGGGGGLVVRSARRVLATIDVAGGDGIQIHATTDPLRAFADRDDDL